MLLHEGRYVHSWANIRRRVPGIVRSTRTEPTPPDSARAPCARVASRPTRAAAANPASASGMTCSGGGLNVSAACGLVSRTTVGSPSAAGHASSRYHSIGAPVVRVVI